MLSMMKGDSCNWWKKCIRWHESRLACLLLRMLLLCNATECCGQQVEVPPGRKSRPWCVLRGWGLVGADSIAQAIELQNQLQELFRLGGLELRKWKSSKTKVSRAIPSQLLDEQHEMLTMANAVLTNLSLAYMKKQTSTFCFMQQMLSRKVTRNCACMW